jgi:ubiquitin-protein ligase
MTTPQEARRIRLGNDYKEMDNIKGDVIQWKPIKGNPPYVEAYEIIIKIRSITGMQPSYRDEHVIYLELPETYPIAPPEINMQTNPPPFHPNWYRNGKWCYGSWDVSEGLGHHVIRMIRTLQFDLEITNPNSPANTDAKDWFLGKQGGNLFPCDHTVLPDPTKDRRTFKVMPPTKRKFEIQS